ncbi:MAG: site-specific DNA-methyltransferase [Saprospiraceae bacterium]
MSEHFELNFVGKKAARELADTAAQTLLSVKDAQHAQQTGMSVLQNHFIEGDNLEVLKLLQPIYTNKIDTIYIDPPYNSGNQNFVYADNFINKNNQNEAKDNQSEFYKNLIISGQRHSDWLVMIYPRLILAQRLLKKTGVIFVSIDEREVAHLKLLMDEIFGEENFIDLFCWAKTETPANLSRKSKKVIEYILCYQKKRDKTKFAGIKKTSKSTNGLLNQTNRLNTLIFPENVVQTKLADGKIAAGMYGTNRYEIELLADTEVRDKIFIQPVYLRAKFKWTQPKLDAEIARGTELFIISKTFSPAYEKQNYAAEVPPNLINMKVGVATNEVASKNLTDLLGAKVFDYPKPVSLLKYLLGFNDHKDGLCLDFFAGSGTLAQAVWEMNRVDEGNRKWICVQRPDACPVGSVAEKNGFSTIADIALKRIEKVRKSDEYFTHWETLKAEPSTV